MQNFQLWVNHHYSDIKHWILVVVGAILLIFALVQYSRSNLLLVQVKELGEQNQQLSKDNKKLSSQNRDLNRQSVEHIDCVAKIFASYTHDFIPVTIQDIDTCTVTVDGKENTLGSTSVPSQSPAASLLDSSSNTTGSPPAPQPVISQPAPAAPQSTTPDPTPTTAPQPSYTECVKSKTSILSTVTGVVSCL